MCIRDRQDIFMAWDEYKSGGGEENFRNWFSDIYLPKSEAGPGGRGSYDLLEIERKAEALVKTGVVENKADAMEILQRSYRAPKRSYRAPPPPYMKALSKVDAPEEFLESSRRLGEMGKDLGRLEPQATWPGGRELLYAQGGRIGAQEGGLMNLGGMEKDYRQEGGFVPIGGEERADDVPARLSKNEFVFTADAVRSAGGCLLYTSPSPRD